MGKKWWRSYRPKLRHAKVKGVPVPGTGRTKFHMPRHWDCYCSDCDPKPRSTRERDAIRDQEA